MIKKVVNLKYQIMIQDKFMEMLNHFIKKINEINIRFKLTKSNQLILMIHKVRFFYFCKLIFDK